MFERLKIRPRCGQLPEGDPTVPVAGGSIPLPNIPSSVLTMTWLASAVPRVRSFSMPGLADGEYDGQ